MFVIGRFSAANKSRDVTVGTADVNSGTKFPLSGLDLDPVTFSCRTFIFMAVPLMTPSHKALSLALLSLAFMPTSPLLANEADEWLKVHNQYRALHQVAPLRWSDALAAEALAYARTCPKGHSKTANGENLAMSSGPLTPTQVVKLWYEEVSLYDYSKPTFSPRTGHFTQVVWQGSQELGCGLVTDCKGRMSHIWVCHYNPPGNVQGVFDGNVLPAEGGMPQATAEAAAPQKPASKRPEQKTPSFLD